jgi:hypothetical protein
MSDAASNACPSLEGLAARVRRRAAAARGLRALVASAAFVGLAGAATVVFLRLGLGWREGELLPLAAIFAVWLLGVAVYALRGVPSVFGALVLLDRAGRWQDRFSSAWLFRQQGDAADPAETLHIERTARETGAAAAGLPAALPLLVPGREKLAWALALPLLALGLASTPLLRPGLEARDLALTERMRETATVQAEELRRQAESFAALEGLDEDERAAVEALRVEVLDTVSMLSDTEGLTAGELLDALAERAQAAERLAERLGLGDDGWASAAMLDEMERHPDLARLAHEIRDKEALAAAGEAEGLYSVLDQEPLAAETRERLALAAERTMRAALEEDRERPVGERIGNADTKLRDGQARTAAREFLELARHFRLLAQREAAQDRLKDLAEAIREAGSAVGDSELQAREELAASPPGAPGSEGEGAAEGGLQPLTPGVLPEDLAELLAPQFTSSGQRPSGESADPERGGIAPAPGLAEAPVPGANEEGGASGSDAGPGGQGEGVLQAPVPGETPGEGGAESGMGLADQSRPGQGEDGFLTAPVPGMDPAGESSPGAGAAGADGSTATGALGGTQAGTGTAPMVPGETGELPASAIDVRVAGQVGEEGESTVRAVEGGARTEQASRGRREIVAEALAAEEQALDGQAIPLSRREHVIRYFSAIRAQFESEDGARRE